MDQQEMERLSTRYPSWRIWTSENGGCLVATRLDKIGLTNPEIYAGLSMTLIEDDPNSLTLALAEQTEIERTL